MNAPPTSSPSVARRSPLGVIFVTVFVDLLGFGIVIPLLPYYARTLHASGAAAGALIACYSAMQFLFAPLWGQLSDRIGRRPVILISLAASTLSYAMFSAAGSLVMLFASRLLAGIGGANIAVAQAYVVDTTNERDRARGMGAIGAAFGLGFVFGPAIGGLLASYGHAAPGVAATMICGANCLVAALRLPESLPAAQRGGGGRSVGHPLGRLRQALRQPQLGVLLALFFASVFAFASMETTLSLLCATVFGLSTSQIYWLFGFMGLMMSLMQGGLIGRLALHVSERRLMASGCALLALGLLATPFTRPFGPLLLALGALAFGQGIAWPTLSSLISKLTEASEQGGVLGVSQSVGSLARILGPLWGGWLFDWGPARPYVTTGLLMVGATVVALRVGRASDTEAPAPERLSPRG
jgi:DHA1 family tetracycline resistance protein-like MFS transporter